MPEKRLQRTREAYREPVVVWAAGKTYLERTHPRRETSAAFRITQAQLAKDAKDEGREG